MDQKEYLKRYLGGGSDGSKKKKKKKEIRGKSITIIDPDVDVGRMQSIETDDLEVFQTGEDAPQVCGVIDDRPPELRALDFKNSTKWKVISDDNGFESDLIVQETDADGRIRKPGKSSNSKKKSVSFGGPPEDDSLSPPRRRKDSPDLSPMRKGGGGSPPRNRRNSDPSPPRRKRQDRDESPPRRQRKDSDTSPPRRRQASPDSSPPRRGRRERSDEDLSPVRKRGNNSPDQSPPRRGKNRSRSPERRRRQSRSPDRRPKQRSRSPRDSRKRRSEDRSPPRRYRNSSRDLSPPRNRDRSSDQSPPRRKRWDGPSSSSNSQRSPDRRNRSPDDRKREKRRWDSPDRNKSRPTRSLDSSPPRRSKHSSPGPSNKRMERTLDGKMAGLQSAKALRVETEAFREREKSMFDQMSAEMSGRNADVVRRDRKTGRVRNMEAEMEKERIKDQKERERKEIYDRWGKGVKQVDDHRKRREEEQHEMSKPLARYAGDDDLEQHLRNQQRDGDPMLAYIREKEREKKRATGQLITMPKYQGSYPDNRFGIPPGYRWDGVDRSNGYEKKYFDVQSKKKASEEEAYRYSTEDM